MKVKELVEVLNSKNPEGRVTVMGYEGGYSDIARVSEISIAVNVNTESYYGPHEDSEKDGDEEAILICRGENPLSVR